MYNTMFIHKQPYISLNTIASALCLNSSLIEDLAMAKDYNGTVEIVDDEVMIPFDVFKRMRLPQDEHYFKIVAAYLKGRIKKEGGGSYYG